MLMARLKSDYALEGLWLVSVALWMVTVFHCLGYHLNIVKALKTGSVPSALC